VRRAGSILCLAAVCALAAGGGLANAAPAPTTIASGVYIGSVSVGGLTGAQATTAVKAAYLSPLVVRTKHRKYSVETRHFRVVAHVATAVQAALTAPQDTTVPLTPTYDMARIGKWVKTLAARLYQAPSAGTLVLRRAHPRFIHWHLGRALQKFAARILIRDAILAGDRTPIRARFRVLSAASVKSEPIIVIHRGVNRLVLFRGTHWVRAFPVATGQAIYPTPLGHFEIVIKEKNPWWYPPTQDAWAKGLKPVPPGPGNPLGTRWMGLSAPGVGIHGTDEPWSIGHSESHGCIRMQVPDAEWLYRRVTVGTPVFIVSH
jgi:lipoprotein-anchoring transpeptidase ErfK/SrfK